MKVAKKKKKEGGEKNWSLDATFKVVANKVRSLNFI
jgi:hypothetical protein